MQIYFHGLHIHLFNSLASIGPLCIAALLGQLRPEVNGFLWS